MNSTPPLTETNTPPADPKLNTAAPLLCCHLPLSPGLFPRKTEFAFPDSWVRQTLTKVIAPPKKEAELVPLSHPLLVPVRSELKHIFKEVPTSPQKDLDPLPTCLELSSCVGRVLWMESSASPHQTLSAAERAWNW